MDEICDGKFEIILSHPEALFQTQFGRRLLDTELFVSKVSAVVVDECHTIEEW